MAELSTITETKSRISAESIVEPGKRPYFLAKLALIDMRTDVNNDQGSALHLATLSTKKAINAIHQAHLNDEFVPPLTEALAETVSEALEYSQSDQAFIRRRNDRCVELDREALDEAALIIAAVVNHGLGGEE